MLNVTRLGNKNQFTTYQKGRIERVRILPFFLPCGMKKICLLSFIAISFLVTSCLKDKTSPINPSECQTIVSYSLDIVPIINSSCITGTGPGTGCHDAWILEYSGVVPAIENQTIYNELFVDHTMPEIPNSWGIDSLSTEEKRLFKCWIDQGYPEN